MSGLLRLLFGLVVDLFRSRAALEVEIIVLRQQITVLRRGKPNRLTFMATDRLGLDLPTVSQRPRGPRHRTTEDRRALASRGLSILLALEVETPAGSPCPVSGNPEIDPRDEHCQSLVGCASEADGRLRASVDRVHRQTLLMLDRVRRYADEFDILHFHIDQFHFPLFRPIAHRTVTTLHGRQDLPDLKPLYVGFADMPLVSISEAQREPIAKANLVATIHHGLPKDLYTPTYYPRGGYVAFIGRISPEKRPDRAIRLAQALGIPLKIAAKVDKVDDAYFREKIAPLLDQPGVEFIGEINDRAKTEFLGQARALLFPIDWPEPFGLSMIEAMACGTPVLAFRHGSVPEVIDQGVTGFMVNSMEEAVRTLPRVLALDRHAVRRQFEKRFSATRMAKDYVALYRSLLKHPMRSSETNGLEVSIETGLAS